MAYSTGGEYELESKIWEMSSYLDRLVMGEDKDRHFGPDYPSSAAAINARINLSRRAPPGAYVPTLSPHIPSINQFPLNSGIAMAQQPPLTRVTSALASRLNTFSSTLRFVNPAPHPRARKWGNYKQSEKEPDTSEIDICATMSELRLTPESLRNNEVYRLFSTYNKLAFYIHADYIFEGITENKTLPNTMSASVQTRHAVWSSNKLLRQLRDSLKKYAHVPSEYQGPFGECKQSLEELHAAILKLETFKYCVLEHRKGKFVSLEAHENLEPLMTALNVVISCVGKSRMYIQVMEWILKKCQSRREAVTDGSFGRPSKPISEDCPLEPHPKGRPTMARRYIG